MTNEELATLCDQLMRVDTEAQVIEVLTAAGYWTADVWRPISDNESNFSIVGNQQGDPISALVEKLINSVDARLVDACLRSGSDPESPDAPSTMRDAVAKFIQHKDPRLPSAGRLSEWGSAELTDQGKLLTLAATGNKPDQGRGNPSLTIADLGEGQTPDDVPNTFMSLNRGNKLRIPFVQGKFNMGGTGALQFCGGESKLQLIITRRDPELLSQNASQRDHEWSFTVVRRELPKTGARSSVFTYLAPLNADTGEGGVLSFAADTWPIFPESDSDIRNAYSRSAEYGSLIKLYEYEIQGTRSNIIQSGGGLLRRLETGLPELALPVRLYEMRDYAGKSGSYATNAVGLVLRLDQDKAENLEPEAPLDASITVAEKQIPLRIYVFKEKAQAQQYRVDRRQGVVFGVNGQAHGSYSLDLFKRKSVNLGYIADCILVYADCSEIDGQTREDLFLNSRDRLRDNSLSRKLEKLIEEVLHTNPTLREINNRRKKELVDHQLEDDRPLTDVLKDLIKSNALLSKLFASGLKLPAAFPPTGVGEGSGHGSASHFVGKRFPTYFRVKGHPTAEPYSREAQLGRKARISFETDAEDGYFIRPVDPGAFEVQQIIDGQTVDVLTALRNGPTQGLAFVSIELPVDAAVGDHLHYLVRVSDLSRDDALESQIDIVVVPKEESGGGGGSKGPRSKNAGEGGDGGGVGGLALPQITLVREAEWSQHEFNQDTALIIIPDDGSHRYFVNVDNRYLRIAQKDTKSDPLLLERQFTYSLVLLGLAIVQELEKSSDEEQNVESFVATTATAVAPVLLPMLQSIGELALVEA